jgi:hypothetical protein
VSTKSFDRESRSHYRGRLSCSIGHGHVVQSNVTLDVEDVDDSPPFSIVGGMEIEVEGDTLRKVRC